LLDVWTPNKVLLVQSVLTAAVEAGHSTALLPPASADLADVWLKVVRFNPIYQDCDGSLLDAEGEKVL
jgi:hypothetical protein